MRARSSWLAKVLLGAAALGLAGCVAAIREERLAGAPRPAIDSRSQVTGESRAGAPALTATVRGARVDVGVTQDTLCRQVRSNALVEREVEIVRSFADDAQERNVAVTFLLGAAVGLLAYSANQAACPPSARGCSLGAATAAEGAMVGVAAIPLGFLAYNAVRVQDGRVLERAAAQREEGAWSVCSTRPMAGEPVEVSAGGAVWRGVTGPDGHVGVDLASLPRASGDGVPERAVARHPGSPDVPIELGPSARSSP